MGRPVAVVSSDGLSAPGGIPWLMIICFVYALVKMYGDIMNLKAYIVADTCFEVLIWLALWDSRESGADPYLRAPFSPLSS